MPKFKCCMCQENEVERALELCSECRKEHPIKLRSERSTPHITISAEEWANKPELNTDKETMADINRKQLKILEEEGHFENGDLAASMGMTKNQYRDHMYKKMVLHPKRQRRLTAEDFGLRE